MKPLLVLFLLIPFNYCFSQEKKINVVVIGAHPDDADWTTGGTAIQFAREGHNVLFVSLTNGDAGHQSQGGGALAKRRRAEAEEAGRRFDVTYKVLDYHDGELLATLDLRKEVIRLIREWNADIVIGPRPYDYHPDHRNTAIVVQDAAYLVIVPNIVSDTPPLKKNPVFLYSQDNFQKPYPFIPDIAIDITDLFDRKIEALSAHESQYFEWLPWTRSDEVPDNHGERMKQLKAGRRRAISPAVRESLVKWYGRERGDAVKVAEAFEICEFGHQPSQEEIRKLFPMIP
ncbi:MAG: PIG-L family deacetylase [Proteiniphilum sp.]|nr:PIG-L family deacetylase [Proteiniphilum sp.]